MSEIQESEPRTAAYITVAVVIFSLVAFTFLFPCNFLIPLGISFLAKPAQNNNVLF